MEKNIAASTLAPTMLASSDDVAAAPLRVAAAPVNSGAAGAVALPDAYAAGAVPPVALPVGRTPPPLVTAAATYDEEVGVASAGLGVVGAAASTTPPVDCVTSDTCGTVYLLLAMVTTV